MDIVIDLDTRIEQAERRAAEFSSRLDALNHSLQSAAEEQILAILEARDTSEIEQALLTMAVQRAGLENVLTRLTGNVETLKAERAEKTDPPQS